MLMSGMLIFHYNILDRSRIDKLGPLVEPVLKKYKGEIVIGNYVMKLEGESYSHCVAYKFESQRAALEFFHSEEHQAVSKLRNEITDGIAFMVAEFGHEPDLSLRREA